MILRQQSTAGRCSRDLFFSLFILVIFTSPALAEINGTVTRVFDGDTLEVKDSGDIIHRVRLLGIDAPERGQAFSDRSRRTLSDLVFSREVKVVTDEKDVYGRHLGDVFVSGLWVNREMIRKGMAWHYKYFSIDSRLANSEIYARNGRLGLWSDPDPVPPWIVRRQSIRGAPQESDLLPGKYWLNTSSGVRHNSSCKHFMSTLRGRFCGPEEGRPCGECGG